MTCPVPAAMSPSRQAPHPVRVRHASRPRQSGSGEITTMPTPMLNARNISRARSHSAAVAELPETDSGSPSSPCRRRHPASAAARDSSFPGIPPPVMCAIACTCDSTGRSAPDTSGESRATRPPRTPSSPGNGSSSTQPHALTDDATRQRIIRSCAGRCSRARRARRPPGRALRPRIASSST